MKTLDVGVQRGVECISRVWDGVVSQLSSDRGTVDARVATALSIQHQQDDSARQTATALRVQPSTTSDSSSIPRRRRTAWPSTSVTVFQISERRSVWCGSMSAYAKTERRFGSGVAAARSCFWDNLHLLSRLRQSPNSERSRQRHCSSSCSRVRPPGPRHIRLLPGMQWWATN